MTLLISRIATKQGLVILVAIYVVVFGAILYSIAQLHALSGQGILDFERGYSKDRVAEVFASYGDAGFALYRRIQLLDLINPALYSTIASAFTFLIWKNRGPWWLCLVPFLGGLGDYAENVTIFMLSQSYPELPDGLVELSSFLSLTKNGLLAVAILPLVVGLVMVGARQLGRRH